MKNDVTFLGIIRRVIGAKLIVEISENIPSASPIIHGRIYRLGQVGSFVRIPLGFLNLYGVVSMVGASEISNLKDADIPFPYGQRWIEVQLMGESYGKEEFQRGISIFPTIDDEVHIVTDDDLAIIYGQIGSSMIEIGTYAASESLKAYVDIDKIVTRHAAIVGSTGSGKSNTVAAFLKALSKTDFPSAQIVVIDPHGEYRSAFKGHARVFSLDDEKFPFKVPHWALSFEELLWLLVDSKTPSGGTQDVLLRDYISNLKQERCQKLSAGKIDSNLVKADTPIPFDLRQMWYDLYVDEFATLEQKDAWDKIAYKKDAAGKAMKGDPKLCIPPQFEPPGNGPTPPFKSTRQRGLGAYLNKMMGRLHDNRFDFLFGDNEIDGEKKDLNDFVNTWLNHDNAITVLDLGGIPPEVTDLIVGVITRILYEAMFWGRDLPGIGKQRPLLLVFEEAHSYLPKGTGKDQFVSGYANRSVRRVFKEGRKYGVGAIVVSQRPSDLDDTILSQCGTFIALRLSNSDDQGKVKSIVPDVLSGLIDLLPALRTGEALVLGEAVKIPSRVRFPRVEPRPKSEDSEPAKEWKKKRVDKVGYDKAITGWRSQKIAKP